MTKISDSVYIKTSSKVSIAMPRSKSERRRQKSLNMSFISKQVSRLTSDSKRRVRKSRARKRSLPEFFFHVSLFLRPLVVEAVAVAAADDAAMGSSLDHRVDFFNALNTHEARTHRQKRFPDHHSHNSSSQWPVKRVAEIPGDIVIGGLHMIHEREDAIICGPVMPQGGLQA